MDNALQREESVFYAALEAADSAARNAFLEHACEGDIQLRAAVDGLLAAHGEADHFFAQSGAALPLPEAGNWPSTLNGIESEILGTFIGPYKLLQRLGEGGCGVVCLAEQDKPVRRRVALKIIKLGMDTKKVIARFEAEQQALALMDHPNIARVLDAGATSQGRPYFVMDLVRGVKITEFCDDHELDTRQRLKLFIEVCRAIQHAHQKGVIHRDIKPSNILVAMHDGAPVPKVIDFGIAKAIEGRLTDNTIYTPNDQFVGTPAYMSPEQAEVSGLDVDTRSDIYSLGVLLYELLTGKTPFDTKELIGSGLEGMRRTLRNQEPQRPSVILTTMQGSVRLQTARCRHSDPLKLISMVRGDLDWIVLRALEKDRTRRYETVNGLAMDVQRFLKNEPVTARPPSRLYRLHKLIRRNRLAFAAGAAVILALVGGLGVSTWMFFKERAAERQQMQLRLQAEDGMKVSQAAFLISQGKFSKADELVEQVSNFQPSLEAESVLRSLGSWHAIQQQWSLAAERFCSLLEVDQRDFSGQICLDLLAAGSIYIEREDLQGYQQFRQKAVSRYMNTTDPVAASRILKLGLLMPADPQTLKQMEPMADLAASSLKGHTETNSTLAAWRCLSLSLMAYRQGNFAAAKEWGERSQSYSTETSARSATIHVIQAMACHRLGEAEQSRSELAEGQKIIKDWFAGGSMGIGYTEGFWYDWLAARSLMHEAEQLLKASSSEAN